MLKRTSGNCRLQQRIYKTRQAHSKHSVINKHTTLQMKFNQAETGKVDFEWRKKCKIWRNKEVLNGQEEDE